MTIHNNNLWSITTFIKNSRYNYNKEKILKKLPKEFIEEAVKSITSWNNYKPTPLIKL